MCWKNNTSADPDNWTPEISKFDSVAADMESIGGLYFNPEAVMNAHTVIYIGEKKEQLVGILLRLSDCRVISCSPQSSNKMELHRGQETKEFRERYVGVMRVKEAEIIGLIVGSMGIDDATMRTLVDQLTRYIEAAGKKCYCFAMGRINEAKLCNFPEINVFCLISNDDTARVPAKTFHVPVVTPFELELGLGAREWDCMYVSSASYSLASDEEYSQRLKLIESGRSRSSSYSSNDTDEVALPSTTATDSSAMTVKSGSQLTVFHSAAADYLAQRDYRGLESTVPVDQSVDVLPGQFGVASGYDRSGVNK